MLELKYLPLLYGAINAQSGDGNFDRITDGKNLSLVSARQNSSWEIQVILVKFWAKVNSDFDSFVCRYMIVIDFKYWFYWYFETFNWSIFNMFISFPIPFLINSKIESFKWTQFDCERFLAWPLLTQV